MRRRTLHRIAALVVLLASCLLPGCPERGAGPGTPTLDTPQAAPEAPAAQPATAPLQPPATSEPSVGPPPTTAAQTSDRVAARHILLAYEGAASQPLHTRRSRSSAQELAQSLLERLAAGEEFEALARESSDCPSAERGGFLGGFDRGTMHPAFEQATYALQPGEFSGVVETPFGFHLIRREQLAEVRVAQVLVQWSGALGSSAQRSRDQALAIAQQALDQLRQGQPFEQVARDFSDGAAGLRGGDLGWFVRGQFVPDWEAQVFALQPGETSAIIETGAGFHLVKRLE